LKDFNYFNPVKVKFGAGIKSEIGRTLKGKYECF
jgi:alcohol dehydrogenase YqhD (iron-dependent ADH family)